MLPRIIRRRRLIPRMCINTRFQFAGCKPSANRVGDMSCLPKPFVSEPCQQFLKQFPNAEVTENTHNYDFELCEYRPTLRTLSIDAVCPTCKITDEKGNLMYDTWKEQDDAKREVASNDPLRNMITENDPDCLGKFTWWVERLDQRTDRVAFREVNWDTITQNQCEPESIDPLSNSMLTSGPDGPMFTTQKAVTWPMAGSYPARELRPALYPRNQITTRTEKLQRRRSNITHHYSKPTPMSTSKVAALTKLYEGR